MDGLDGCQIEGMIEIGVGVENVIVVDVMRIVIEV